MPEAEAPQPLEKSPDTIALSAATMGHDLVAMLLGELRTMPGDWSKLNADMQQKIIERIKDKVAGAVLKAQHMLTASNFQAVPAKLEFVNRKAGIRAGITVASDALCRHALFDAAGGKVLVVIVDPQQWLHRMDEIKAVGNQADLFDRTDANYDPKKDQPGYRRDQDPFAPAAPSWDAMKQKLGLDGTKPPEPEPKPPGSETIGSKGGTVPPGADPAVSDRRAQEHILIERLATLKIDISLGALQTLGDADILAAFQWLENEPVERPHWIPEPRGDSK